MNGIFNAVFIVLLIMVLVALGLLYTVGDTLVTQVNVTVNQIAPNNYITNAGMQAYVNTRDLIFNTSVNILFPFIILLALSSSFINNNQSIITYLIQAIAVLMVTPLLIYIFSFILTDFFAVGFISPQYIITSYTDNFLYILVANMFMSLVSFVFVRRMQSSTGM